MAIVADLRSFATSSGHGNSHSSKAGSQPPEGSDPVAKLNQLLPQLAVEEEAQIRQLLWRPERAEILALYRRRQGRQATPGIQAVIAELGDLVAQGTWFGQRDLARRVFDNPDHVGPVLRVLKFLRETGVLVSEGGEFVPARGKASCQRHCFAAAAALLEVTSPYRLVAIRAYAWLTSVAGWSAEAARDMVRRRGGLDAMPMIFHGHAAKTLAKAAAAAAKAVHSEATPNPAVSISEALPSAFLALQSGTSHLQQSLPEGSLCPEADPAGFTDQPIALMGRPVPWRLRRRRTPDDPTGLPPEFVAAAFTVGDQGLRGTWSRLHCLAADVGVGEARMIDAYAAAVSDTRADQRSRVAVGGRSIANPAALAMWRAIDAIRNQPLPGSGHRA